MALSEKAKRRLEVAMARRQEAQEVIDAIEAGSNPAAEDVDDLGALDPVGTTDGVAVDAALAADVDDRIATLQAKIDEILAALRAAGLMA